MLFVSSMQRSVKILILNKEGIIEKISYERRDMSVATMSR